MLTRTFISKCNTIASGSKENFGLNPVCSLNYGAHISRILLYFNEAKIKDQVEDHTFKNEAKLKHYLKMTNCGSINPEKFFDKQESKHFLSQKHRAASFDIIAFKVPQKWDAGTGFDNSTDTWFLGYNSSSQDGSTWEKAKNEIPWETNGIYAKEFLQDELDKWENGETSVIIGIQHFDYGNENLNIDITDFVNSVVYSGETNNGICLAFSPYIEETKTAELHYINFFTNHTNTFFAPYIETHYDISINDDRYKFYLGKTNRLYFYSIIGGKFVELDEMPVCEISAENAEISEVQSESKGIYYVEVKLPINAKEKQILTDTWSNLKLNGEDLGEVERDFVTLPARGFFNFGEDIEDNIKLSPVISGINDDQKLERGDMREITVVFRVPYTSAEYKLVDESFYRIYVKDGNREIDVVDWEPINSIGNKNMFTIVADEFMPQQYYMDIKAVLGRQTLIFKDKLHFKVADNITDLKK